MSTYVKMVGVEGGREVGGGGEGGGRREEREGSLVSRPHPAHAKIRVYCHKSKSL